MHNLLPTSSLSVYGLFEGIKRGPHRPKITSIFGHILLIIFGSSWPPIQLQIFASKWHPTWYHICINLHGCIRRAVPRHPEIQDAAGVASAIFCPCCTNCETRPFHLPEADCPIFALLVSRSASW